MNFINILIFTFLLIILVSCISSKINEANKLYDNGLYEDAEKYYSEILEKSSSNTEAKVGLLKTRIELTNKILVSIRLMRLSGQMDNSAEMLNDFLIKKWQEWKLDNISSAQISSLQDELSHHIVYLENKINSLLKSEKILQAEDILKKYNSIFSSLKILDRKSLIHDKLIKFGSNKCNKLYLLLDRNSIYFSKTVDLYCKYFGVKKGFSFIDKSSDFKYSKISLKGDIKLIVNGKPGTLKDELIQKFNQKITESMQNSFMYKEESMNTLNLNFKGNISYSVKSTSGRFSHSYNEQIPYTAYETKVYSVPYLHCFPNFMTGQNQCFTKYRNEEREVPVTKYKDEPRIYYYQGIKNHEFVILDIFLKQNLVNFKTVQSILNDKIENSFIVHNENVPNIGLSPSTEEGMNLLKYLEEKFELISNKFFNELKISYTSKFCDSRNKDQKIAIEYVERCGIFDEENPKYIQFYNKEFGLKKSDLVEKLLSLEKT